MKSPDAGAAERGESSAHRGSASCWRFYNKVGAVSPRGLSGPSSPQRLPTGVETPPSPGLHKWLWDQPHNWPGSVQNENARPLVQKSMKNFMVEAAEHCTKPRALLRASVNRRPYILDRQTDRQADVEMK